MKEEHKIPEISVEKMMDIIRKFLKISGMHIYA